MTAYGTQKPDLPQDVLLSEAERDMLAAHRPGFGSRSKIEAAFNLVNSTVGAGIIGLPFAIYLAGFWRAIVLSIIVSILSVHGMYLLIAAGKRVGAYKFAVLMEFVMGRFGFHFLNLIMIIQAGGACVSYFICKFSLTRFFFPSYSRLYHFFYITVIGDTIPVLLELYFPQYPSLSQRELVTVFIAIFFVSVQKKF
jgi:sodium-coupled neutral amino acid transporter 11